MEDEIGYCIRYHPELLDKQAESAQQLVRCIKKASGFPVVAKIVKMISCYENSLAKIQHFDLSQAWAEILLNPESQAHLPAFPFAYSDYAVLFGLDSDKNEIMPIVLAAMPLLGSLQLRALRKIVMACRNGMLIPRSNLGLGFYLSEFDAEKLAEACDLHLDLLELAKDLPLEHITWIHDDIRMLFFDSCGFAHEGVLDEQRLRRAITLMRQAKEPDKRFLNEYIGILANICLDKNQKTEAFALFDEIAPEYESMSSCPPAASEVWERLREERPRPWHNRSHSVEEIAELLERYCILPDTSFVSSSGNLYISNVKPCVSATHMSGIIELQLANQTGWVCTDNNYHGNLYWGTETSRLSSEWWSCWYRDFSNDLVKAWKPDLPGEATATIILKEQGAVTEVSISPAFAQEHSNQLDDELFSQFRHRVESAIKSLEGRSCLVYPEADLLRSVKISALFWAQRMPGKPVEKSKRSCALCKPSGRLQHSWEKPPKPKICKNCAIFAWDCLNYSGKIEAFPKMANDRFYATGTRPCTICKFPSVLAPILHPHISVCLRCAGDSYKLPALNLVENPPRPAALKLLPKALMIGKEIVPVSKHGSKVSVVMACPDAVMLSAEVRKRLGKYEVSWFTCDHDEFSLFVESTLNK